MTVEKQIVALSIADHEHNPRMSVINGLPFSIMVVLNASDIEYDTFLERIEAMERIVKTWNVHDDLIKALQGVIRVADRDTDEFHAARAALAKAGAE